MDLYLATNSSNAKQSVLTTAPRRAFPIHRTGSFSALENLFLTGFCGVAEAIQENTRVTAQIGYIRFRRNP
jgi:hypothetical protein